jgi:hypothetical protein
MVCASTRARSETKARRDTALFAFIGFPHAENVAIRATRGVAHNYHAVCEQAIADDARFVVVLSPIFDLKRDTRKDYCGICNIQSTLGQRFLTLDRIVSNSHELLYLQKLVATSAIFQRIKDEINRRVRQFFVEVISVFGRGVARRGRQTYIFANQFSI